MRYHFRLSALCLLTAAALAVAAEPPQSTCDTFGTSVQFEASPSAAARRALKEEKLVFVLHVSGNFEESEFT
jgi:hypothetical protein